jgi:hypothetical protein
MLQGETKPIRRIIEGRFDEVKAIAEGPRAVLPPETASWCVMGGGMWVWLRGGLLRSAVVGPALALSALVNVLPLTHSHSVYGI